MNLKRMPPKVLFKVFKSLKVKTDKNIQAFFALFRAGLWEYADANLNDKVDWQKVYQLAEEQSVVGLVLAGIECSYVKPSQDLLLQWIGEVQILEQQNKAMNKFISDLVDKMRAAGIYSLLVKGQGIAQCYERPLWRLPGDVDLLLSEDNYSKAETFLTPLASHMAKEKQYNKHLAMTISDWEVELHGNLRCGLSAKIDRVLDSIKNDIFYGGSVRSWMNGRSQIFLPAENGDVIYVFTHILQHFYRGGIGLRQICDWCRLLWTFKDSLNHGLLESRIRKMGLMSEWKAFGAFAVDYLGMPSEAMPFYSDSWMWKRKADKICTFILEVGNFGHNRDSSYFNKYPYVVRKVRSLGRRCGDLIRHARIFPMDSFRFLLHIFKNGIQAALRGE